MTWQLTEKFGSSDRSPTRYEWNSLGYKKLEDEVVTGKRRSESVPIWFHKGKNEFAAHFLGLLFVEPTYSTLVDKLGHHLLKFEEMPFERFLSIRYEQKRESIRYGIGSRQSGGRDDDRPVCGFRLEFDVLDISPPFLAQRRNGKAKVRTWRRMALVNGEWTVECEETHDADYLERRELLPFTDERYRTLLGIVQSIADLDRRLNVFLGDGGNAKLLDGFAARFPAIPATPLLPAPKSYTNAVENGKLVRKPTRKR